MQIGQAWIRWKHKKQEKLAVRSILQAKHARLSWRIETKELIEDVEKSFPQSALHRRRIIRFDENDIYHIQIEAFSGTLLPAAPGKTGFNAERPGSLTYIMTITGAIIVSAFPHQSDHSRIGDGSAFILDVIPALSLAGQAGRHLIEKHLVDFHRLCMLSMVNVQPSKRGGKFLASLQNRSDRYKTVYTDPKEQRKNRILQGSNFGIGLAGGILASTLLPMLPEVGNIARNKSQAIWKLCSNQANLQECLTKENYSWNVALGHITTPKVVLFGAVLILLVIVTVNHVLKRR